jgi:hypothetical protein
MSTLFRNAIIDPANDMATGKNLDLTIAVNCLGNPHRAEERIGQA